jgi:4,5-DOPA dioxygenase extradiol
MPIVFIGHGSPMNAIENNQFTRGWQELAHFIPRPAAILSVSAHWQTKGTKVLTDEHPKTIHDFYGFPKELYDIQYPVNGCPELAEKAIKLLNSRAAADEEWGIDHGTWSILHIMYPEADIPVFQVSLDANATPQEHFEMGRKLKTFREQNVLIFGSGNIVHNLGMVDFSMDDGYDWANYFDNSIKRKIEQRDFDSILNYQTLGNAAKQSVPTSEHFDPLFYILGAANADDNLKIFNHTCTMGSLSMTSYVFY